MPAHRLHTFDDADRNHPYFVTIRAQRGAYPFISDALCADIVSSLHWLRSRGGIVLYAYCLMPDHLHLLLRLGPKGTTLGDVVMRFKQFTTRKGWARGCDGVRVERGG